MNENKTTTYGDLKNRKKELRIIMVEGELTESTIEDYQRVVQAIKEAEACLLWGITPDESCGKLPIEPKVYKRVKYVVIAITIAVIVMILLSGCQTFKGATGDTAWMFQKLSDNIQVEK